MIYVDNAATTYFKPPEMIEQVCHYLKHPGNPFRGIHQSSMNASRMILDTRIALADFFDCQFQHVIFTSGITESLNTVIQGLFSKDDHIVTTYLEHNSVLRPLYRLHCPLSICAPFVEEMEKQINEKTKAIIMNHVSNVTGEINDLKAIGQLCQKYHLLFIVDCAQSAGLLPLSMKDNHIDILCFTGHKGLLAMQGIGGIALSSSLDIKPLKVGGTGNLSFQKQQPEQYPAHLEAGTLNVPGILSLNTSLNYIQKKGIRSIYEHEVELANMFIQEVSKWKEIIIYREDEKQYTGIVSLNVKGIDGNRVSDLLARFYDIETRAGAHCAPLVHKHYHTKSMVRFSFGLNNTTDDVRKCIVALKKIIEGEKND